MKQETTTITSNELTPEQATQQVLLRFVIGGLTQAATRFAALTDEAENGNAEAVEAMPKASAAFRKAGEAVLDERRKLDRLLGRLEVGEAGVELDLDAARAEIRRRMDRLRASHGAGGVSE
jgi:hypothetical protein